MHQLIEKIKKFWRGPTLADVWDDLPLWEETFGVPFFTPEECIASKIVRKHGVGTRQFNTTRHDN